MPTALAMPPTGQQAPRPRKRPCGCTHLLKDLMLLVSHLVHVYAMTTRGLIEPREPPPPPPPPPAASPPPPLPPSWALLFLLLLVSSLLVPCPCPLPLQQQAAAVVWTGRAGAEAHVAIPAARGSCSDVLLEAAGGMEFWLKALREGGASGLAQGSEHGALGGRAEAECRSRVSEPLFEAVPEGDCEELYE